MTKEADMAAIAEINGPAAWRAEHLTGATAWQLPPSGEPGPETTDEIGHELATGRGFALLRGAPVTGDPEATALRLAARLGRLVPQGPDGALARHVRDEGADPAHSTTRSYQHNQRLGYHADPTAVVALLCVRPAAAGGLSSIVSAVAVHDEIVRTRPDLAEVLHQPWWFDRRSGDGPDSFYQRPVYENGRLVAYGPDYMRSAQRGPQVPPLTPAQREALDLLETLTHDPRFALTMDLRAGDMQFLNNRVVLHSRTAYRDDPAHPRHLIRVWLEAG
jgi:hypothetical protein